jgi:hypothetical protein
MKNQKILLAVLTAALVGSALVLPKLGHADGIDIHAGGVNVDIHDGEHHRREERHWLHHEEMDAALANLRDARAHLDKGGHDFGGHRVRAIRLADKAIAEITASVEYANTHER